MEAVTDLDATRLGEIKVLVHPIVAFQVLDAYMRRPEGQTRVVGTLMGLVQDQHTVVALNAFPVPHIEESNVSLDVDFHHKMVELEGRVHPDQVVVGWFATGKSTDENTILFHDGFYASEYVNPIHLLVDTAADSETSRLRAYVARQLSGMGGAVLGAQFVRVNIEVQAHAAERLGLDMLVQHQSSSVDAQDELNAPFDMISEVDALVQSLQKLQSLLRQVSEYVAKKDGRDPAVGLALKAALAATPQIESARFAGMFNKNIQDLLMVVYLANLTRTQIALSEKLQRVL